MDTIFQTEDGKWSFYDETWDQFGMIYDTREQASEALHLYVEYLDTGHVEKEKWDKLNGIYKSYDNL